nr:prolyl aminopeptidase [Thiomicrospira sp. ALE5]
MRQLYPAIEPYQQAWLPVGNGHQIYYEQSGNPQGIPILFVHGGPGGGCSPSHRQFFDPQAYRIILFDQRGSGRSTPHASLEHNTTAHLLADMESLRQHLTIEQWGLFGGSWGSTLSLAYAQTYPQRVLGLILRGIFLCRDQDIAWFYQQGASALFPDYWQDYLAPIPPAQQNDLISAYYQQLTGDDEVARMRAAEAWSVWEGRTSTLVSNPDIVDHFADPHHALAMARIECHYFMHKSFLQENQLLKDVYKLPNVPAWIIHGRYDVVCPIEQAYALHQAWPQAELIVCPNSGHSAFEAEITHSLITTTTHFSSLV